MHAGEDLEAMKAMESNILLTGMVSFHAQQCAEKCFKAVLLEYKDSVPRIHDLVRLYALVVNSCQLDDINMDILRELSDLYIDTRYPSEFGTLPTGRPDLEDASRFIVFAQSLYERISILMQL